MNPHCRYKHLYFKHFIGSGVYRYFIVMSNLFVSSMNKLGNVTETKLANERKLDPELLKSFSKVRLMLKCRETNNITK